MGGRITQEKVDKVLELINAGESFRTIARVVGTSQRTVRNLADRIMPPCCKLCGGELPCIECARELLARRKGKPTMEPPEEDAQELRLSPETEAAVLQLRKDRIARGLRDPHLPISKGGQRGVRLPGIKTSTASPLNSSSANARTS